MERLDLFLERLKEFIKERNWQNYHTADNLAKSIVIEASELLECFQWSNTDYDLEAVKEELADVLNYSLQLAMFLDLDPIDILNKKLDKTALKYPINKNLD